MKKALLLILFTFIYNIEIGAFSLTRALKEANNTNPLKATMRQVKIFVLLLTMEVLS
jgi:hypothetical protein